MAQHDMIISDADGATVLADLNDAFAALASTNSGTGAPATPYAGQLWVDTNSPSVSVWSLNLYDGADHIKILDIDTTANVVTPYIGGVNSQLNPYLGTPTITSPAAGDHSSLVASTAFVQNSICGGFLNRLRNGMMDVSQRAASGSVSVGTTAYTLDGWMVSATGAAAAWAASRNAISVAGAGLVNVLNISTASGLTNLAVKQRLESYFAAPLNGQQVTFQAVIYQDTGSPITPTLSTKHANAIDNFSATTADLAAVSLQACATGVATLVSYTFPAGASSYLGMEVTLDFGSAANIAAKSIYVTACDLRATPGIATGLNASPPRLEMRPIVTELAICQRYLPVIRLGVSTLGIAHATSATTAFMPITFPAETRVAPTGVTLSSAAHFQLLNASGGAYSATSGLAFSNAWTRGAVLSATVASGLAAGSASLFGGNNSSASIIFTGAEL